MRGLGQMLAAAFRAVAAAMAGVWQLVWEGARQVLRFIPKPAPPEPMPAVEAEPTPGDVADGLRSWAQARSKGLMPRLPNGVTPAQSTWALRLARDEIEIVARSAPSAVREHLSGVHQLRGVRPIMRIVQERAAQPDLDESRRSLRAEMHARRMRRQEDWEQSQASEPGSPFAAARF